MTSKLSLVTQPRCCCAQLPRQRDRGQGGLGRHESSEDRRCLTFLASDDGAERTLDVQPKPFALWRFSRLRARLAIANGLRRHFFSFARNSSKKFSTTTIVGVPAISAQLLSRTMRNR